MILRIKKHLVTVDELEADHLENMPLGNLTLQPAVAPSSG
jgi:hypothetical protein